ncbi:MAG: N-6 DNA methylase, partial [Acidobacteria bacterium]|nr:N-6 DNA methylase [Acidobacteriota bacterium]
RGDHFFRSALIQTLFYGIFSAWVLWSKSHPPTDRASRFEWGMAAHYLRVPILRKLFHEVAEPGQLETMNLPEVLDWAGAALNRVDRASFFANFEEGHAVQYFYEPFLEAFDPDLRKDLGVWYTPVEVVKYMVARVDAELRNTLGVEDGLANPNVYILDPCCGTGAYLVEVLRKIEATLREKGGDDLVGHDLKEAALERVFGFEILPAPFVVAHLQLGLLLQSLGAPLSEARHERARVFLTNSLTGWEPVKHPKQLMFREMEEEREAADHVKRDTPILVILGNPPYNSFAGIANMDEERELSQAYRTTKDAPAPQGQGLNDLYIRFFRMADRRIVEKTGKGIVSFISNYSWLDGLSFTGMRERYLAVFDHIWIDCLNGDKYKTGKLTPEGKPDPSVFSTEFNRQGIQVGTAITLLARTSPSEGAKTVQFRHLWGKEKRDQLLAEATRSGTPKYQIVRPSMPLGLPFAPATVAAKYISWPLLPDLLPVSFPGVKTSRDDVVVDIDRDRLVRRMEQYFDPSVSSQEMAQIAPRAMEDGARFPARQIRRYLLNRGFKPEFVVPFYYRPFDLRWLYWEPETKLLDEKRADYFPHVADRHLWLSAAQQNRKAFDPPLVSTRLCSLHMIERGANMFPLLLQPDNSLLHAHDADLPQPNLTEPAAAYLGGVNAKPADLPRIPLPAAKHALLTSAALGREIAALLDPGCPTPRTATSLKSIGLLTATKGRIDPDSGDLEVTAGWGHAGKGGATMPAKGRIVVRQMTAAERDALPDGTVEVLGAQTCDVYLNDRTYWKNVPTTVWEYTLGGYQVIKKWLSYREKELLGRSLTADEARYITSVARRIAAVLLMGPVLDGNYQAVKQQAYSWAGTTREV